MPPQDANPTPSFGGFGLNKRYAPYIKWIHREFYRLPHLAGELGPILENCYGEQDLTLVPDQLNTAVKLLIKHQDGMGDLPRVEVRHLPISRDYFDIGCQYIAEQIQRSIRGKLSKIPLVGAVDQWVGNYDLLINVDTLRPLSSAYSSTGLGNLFP